MKIRELKKQEYPFQSYLFFPENANKNLPLLIYLHGAGERGENLEHLYRHGVPKLIHSGVEIPAVVLCPQCPAEFVWNNVVSDVKKLIDMVSDMVETLKDRICITGSRMGGFGTWEMGLTYPSFFSAIAPVAGGGLSWRCEKLRTTPVRAYHGTEDTLVPIIYSELMVNATNENGGCAELFKICGFGHNDGIDEAYANTDLISWLLSKRRTNFEYVEEFCEDYF